MAKRKAYYVECGIGWNDEILWRVYRTRSHTEVGISYSERMARRICKLLNEDEETKP